MPIFSRLRQPSSIFTRLQQPSSSIFSRLRDEEEDEPQFRTAYDLPAYQSKAGSGMLPAHELDPEQMPDPLREQIAPDIARGMTRGLAPLVGPVGPRSLTKGVAKAVGGYAGAMQLAGDTLAPPEEEGVVHSKIKELIRAGTDIGRTATLTGGVPSRLVGRGLSSVGGAIADVAESVVGATTTEGETGDIFTRLKNQPVSTIPKLILEEGPQLFGSVLALKAGKVAGYGATWAIEAGHTYRDLLEGGADEQDARVGAAVVGTVNGFLERAGAGHILQKAPKNLLHRLATNFVSEGGTEGLQEVPQMLTEVATGVEKGLTWTEAGRRVLGAAITGGIVSGPASAAFGATPSAQPGIQPETPPGIRENLAASRASRELGPGGEYGGPLGEVDLEYEREVADRAEANRKRAEKGQPLLPEIEAIDPASLALGPEEGDQSLTLQEVEDREQRAYEVEVERVERENERRAESGERLLEIPEPPEPYDPVSDMLLPEQGESARREDGSIWTVTSSRPDNSGRLSIVAADGTKARVHRDKLSPVAMMSVERQKALEDAPQSDYTEPDLPVVHARLAPEDVVHAQYEEWFPASKKGKGESVREKLDRLNVEFFNTSAPLEVNQFMEQVVERGRGRAQLVKNPFELGIYETNERGETALDDNGQPKRQLSRPFKEIVRDRDPVYLSVILRAEHGRELAREIKDGSREQKNVQALQAAERALGPEQYGAHVEAAQEIRSWLVNATLGPLVEMGVLTGEDVGRMKSKYGDFYTPMLQVAQELEGEGATLESRRPGGKRWQGKGKPIKRRSSSPEETLDSETRDPLEVIAERVAAVTDFIERQRVAQMFQQTMDANPAVAEKLGIEEVKRKRRPVAYVKPEEIGAEGGEGDTIFRPDPQQPRDTYVVYDKGDKRYIKADKSVLEAINSYGPKEVGILRSLLVVPAQLARAGFTLAPGFALGKGPFRDQFEAAVYSPGLIRGGAYIPFLDMAKGISSMVKDDTNHLLFKTSGSEHATFVAPDRPVLKHYLEGVLQGVPGASGNKLLRYGNVLNHLQTVSHAVEKATRVGLFRKAREGGLSVEEARHVARDGTVDFLRFGTTGQNLNQTRIFLNAQLQSQNKIYRYFMKDLALGVKGDKAALKRAGTAYAKAAVTITMPSVLLWMKNHDDEDYKELPTWEKDLFWHVAKMDLSSVPVENIPGHRLMLSETSKTGQYWLKFPKPFEIGWLFGSIPERMLQWHYEKDPDALVDTLLEFGEQIVPPILPSVAVPVVENIADWKFFFERPVTSPGTAELGDVAPELQYGASTPEIVKAAAGGAAKVGLGKVPIVDQLASPDKLQNLVYGVTGTLGREALGIADRAGQATGLLPEKPGAGFVPFDPTSSRDAPVVGGWMKAFLSPLPQGSRTQTVREFYDQYTRIDKLASRIKKLQTTGHEDEADAAAKAHPEQKYAKPLRRLSSDMAAVNKALALLGRYDTLEPEERAPIEQWYRNKVRQDRPPGPLTQMELMTLMELYKRDLERMAASGLAKIQGE